MGKSEPTGFFIPKEPKGREMGIMGRGEADWVSILCISKTLKDQTLGALEDRICIVRSSRVISASSGFFYSFLLFSWSQHAIAISTQTLHLTMLC
jgi:hypothetical protein